MNHEPNTKDDSLWKTTKNILKVKEQSTHLNGPNGQLAISDKDKLTFLETISQKPLLPTQA